MYLHACRFFLFSLHSCCHFIAFCLFLISWYHPKIELSYELTYRLHNSTDAISILLIIEVNLSSRESFRSYWWSTPYGMHEIGALGHDKVHTNRNINNFNKDLWPWWKLGCTYSFTDHNPSIDAIVISFTTCVPSGSTGCLAPKIFLKPVDANNPVYLPWVQMGNIVPTHIHPNVKYCTWCFFDYAYVSQKPIINIELNFQSTFLMPGPRYDGSDNSDGLRPSDCSCAGMNLNHVKPKWQPQMALLFLSVSVALLFQGHINFPYWITNLGTCTHPPVGVLFTLNRV